MFGYIRANIDDMTPEEKCRYRAVYCGLCRTLGHRHGLFSRLGLTYDMTFLILFLSSLYEPEETDGQCRCVAHPWKKETYTVNEITEYAADMTVALVYHKCMDDWKDERKAFQRIYAAILKKPYRRIRKQRPVQVKALESCMRDLSKIEENPNAEPDQAANCFGDMLGELFRFKTDYWQNALYQFGRSLGQFIYTIDAVMDCEEDRKTQNYNPVLQLNRTVEEMQESLMIQIGQATQVFERLPMVQDAQLLRNILYSGVWLSYNQLLRNKKEAQKNG